MADSLKSLREAALSSKKRNKQQPKSGDDSIASTSPTITDLPDINNNGKIQQQQQQQRRDREEGELSDDDDLGNSKKKNQIPSSTSSLTKDIDDDFSKLLKEYKSQNAPPQQQQQHQHNHTYQQQQQQHTMSMPFPPPPPPPPPPPQMLQPSLHQIEQHHQQQLQQQQHQLMVQHYYEPVQNILVQHHQPFIPVIEVASSYPASALQDLHHQHHQHYQQQQQQQPVYLVSSSDFYYAPTQQVQQVQQVHSQPLAMPQQQLMQHQHHQQAPQPLPPPPPTPPPPTGDSSAFTQFRDIILSLSKMGVTPQQIVEQGISPDLVMMCLSSANTSSIPSSSSSSSSLADNTFSSQQVVTDNHSTPDTKEQEWDEQVDMDLEESDESMTIIPENTWKIDQQPMGKKPPKKKRQTPRQKKAKNQRKSQTNQQHQQQLYQSQPIPHRRQTSSNSLRPSAIDLITRGPPATHYQPPSRFIKERQQSMVIDISDSDEDEHDGEARHQRNIAHSLLQKYQSKSSMSSLFSVSSTATSSSTAVNNTNNNGKVKTIESEIAKLRAVIAQREKYQSKPQSSVSVSLSSSTAPPQEISTNPENSSTNSTEPSEPEETIATLEQEIQSRETDLIKVKKEKDVKEEELNRLNTQITESETLVTKSSKLVEELKQMLKDKEEALKLQRKSLLQLQSRATLVTSSLRLARQNVLEVRIDIARKSTRVAELKRQVAINTSSTNNEDGGATNVVNKKKRTLSDSDVIDLVSSSDSVKKAKIIEIVDLCDSDAVEPDEPMQEDEEEMEEEVIEEEVEVEEENVLEKLIANGIQQSFNELQKTPADRFRLIHDVLIPDSCIAASYLFKSPSKKSEQIHDDDVVMDNDDTNSMETNQATSTSLITTPYKSIFDRYPRAQSFISNENGSSTSRNIEIERPPIRITSSSPPSSIFSTWLTKSPSTLLQGIHQLWQGETAKSERYYDQIHQEFELYETYLGQNPNDVGKWIQYAADILSGVSESEELSEAVDKALHVLSRSLEKNRFDVDTWCFYLELFQRRHQDSEESDQDKTAIRGAFRKSVQFVPHGAVLWWSWYNWESTFAEKLTVLKVGMTSLLSPPKSGARSGIVLSDTEISAIVRDMLLQLVYLTIEQSDVDIRYSAQVIFKQLLMARSVEEFLQALNGFSPSSEVLSTSVSSHVLTSHEFASTFVANRLLSADFSICWISYLSLVLMGDLSSNELFFDNPFGRMFVKPEPLFVNWEFDRIDETKLSQLLEEQVISCLLEFWRPMFMDNDSDLIWGLSVLWNLLPLANTDNGIFETMEELLNNRVHDHVGARILSHELKFRRDGSLDVNGLVETESPPVVINYIVRKVMPDRGFMKQILFTGLSNMLQLTSGLDSPLEFYRQILGMDAVTSHVVANRGIKQIRQWRSDVFVWLNYFLLAYMDESYDFARYHLDFQFAMDAIHASSERELLWLEYVTWSHWALILYIDKTDSNRKSVLTRAIREISTPHTSTTYAKFLGKTNFTRLVSFADWTPLHYFIDTLFGNVWCDDKSADVLEILSRSVFPNDSYFFARLLEHYYRTENRDACTIMLKKICHRQLPAYILKPIWKLSLLLEYQQSTSHAQHLFEKVMNEYEFDKDPLMQRLFHG